MNTKVLYSVFKRNFVGYLSNPTGYVFICVFVLLSSIAAFLPDDFFNANLANLDQLNHWFPLIMLVFIPAITMGIWADERRQGTDELLLTIPASDFDIVLGKFKAAVCIYTISLGFSLVCNLLILKYLGKPDFGLFLCTYIGYWFVGVAMISIGMVASFLTGNLTVSYILGAICCAPFIALQWIDAAPIHADTAGLLKSFSIATQFESFGRGIVTFSGILYFGMITAAMLYLSMILIGRRHWTASRKFVGASHFAVRTVCLLAIGLSLVFIFRHHDLRADLTEEKLSTLSPKTKELLKNLKPEHPVVIEAFLSPDADVPESHVQTQRDIKAFLDEIESICKENVIVRRHYKIVPNTEAALIASQRFDIKPQNVWYLTRGKQDKKSIFLGVAFRSGLESLVLPFIDKGLSVEYELVRALCSVTERQKKRIGILKTDVALFGRFDMNALMMGQPAMSPPWMIIEELQKQYTVVEVDPAQPITEKFDALLAVQPSAMGYVEIVHFVEAIQAGQPTIIFEDPLPYARGVPGTSEPRQGGGNPMMGGRQPPKGNIDLLWELLGVGVDGAQTVWQEYQPIRRLPVISKGLIFLDRSLESDRNISPFNKDDAVTSSLQYMMLPFSGRITEYVPLMGEKIEHPLTVTPLLTTFQQPAGIVLTRLIKQMPRDEWERSCVIEETPSNLAVRIRGELPAPPAPELQAGETPVKPEPTKIDVILVADIDMLSDVLFQWRQLGNEQGIDLNFDNVTFVLNAVDSVAGDDRFLEVRSRRSKHRTLSKIDEQTDTIRKETMDKKKSRQDEYKKEEEEERQKLQAEMNQLREQLEKGGMNPNEAAQKFATKYMAAQKRLESKEERLQWELNIDMEKADVELNEYISGVQGRYKLWSVGLPPIPPLLIAFVVFFVRRIRESEGIPLSRRRK
jgi:ABC-2 type transport system permease protein